jgi:hypothetical protein
LIRQFNEETTKKQGEHWTPRDAVILMANLLFRPVADRITDGAERRRSAGANLTDVDFTGADLSGANKPGGITGTPAILPVDWRLVGGYLFGPGAGLTDADSASFDLAGVDLMAADLTDADLADADLYTANMTDAVLFGITWSNSECPDGTNSDNDGGTCAYSLG